MEFSFLAFIIVSIATISGSFYFNFAAGRTMAAGIQALGFFIAALVFGMRWFTPEGEVQAPSVPAKWPPSVNVCPDFLSLITVNTEKVCVDPVGVNRGGMDPWSSSNQTDEKFLFHLHLDKSGSPRVEALCEEAKKKGVTWEGVWNGTVCLGREPPAPSAAA